MEEKLNQIIEITELIITTNQEIKSEIKQLNEKVNKLGGNFNKLDRNFKKLDESFNKLDEKVNNLDKKFEAKYNQIIKEISFELREMGDVIYQAMDRKDNKSKDEIKHYMQNKEEQKLNLIKSTVNNLIKLNDQNLHQMV